MRRSVAILFFVIMCGFGVNAQQDAQFTLFPWANYYFNPGSAGEQHNTLCFTGLFRQQYAGYQDAIPNTDSSMSTGGQQILFNMESYLRKLKGGLGLSLIKDKNGQFQNVGLRLGYAYKLNLPSGRLGIGFQVGFLLFIPFIVIDMVVASTLMSMGMMMLPPMMISLPFKILLFVLVDGWDMVIKSIIIGFN